MLDLQCCRLLIVEDDLDSQLLLTWMFEELGVEVMTAASAHEAFKVLAWFKPNILLCDIVMPEVDGFNFIRSLRSSNVKHWQRIPAIAVTALLCEYSQQEAFAAGFQAYFVKPVDLDKLAIAVSALLGCVA